MGILSTSGPLLVLMQAMAERALDMTKEHAPFVRVFVQWLRQ